MTPYGHRKLFVCGLWTLNIALVLGLVLWSTGCL